MSNLNSFTRLKVERDAKYAQINSLMKHMEIFNEEIAFRERAIEDLKKQMITLQEEAQVICNMMLEREYDCLLKEGI